MFSEIQMFNHKGHEGTQRSWTLRGKLLRVPSCPLWLPLFLFLLSCSSRPSPDTLVMLIEFSPANLDPRIGTDAQSERIDQLIFDSLVHRDEHFNMQPWVAESWEIPDPKTYIFHVRRGIRFHDGRPLAARAVQWTLESIRNGSLITLKATTYKLIDHIEAPDDSTLIIHLSEPDGTLLYNVSDGAFGTVPFGSDKQFNRNPIGSRPFRFLRNDPDSQVVIVRDDDYWGPRARAERVRFAVVPDETTRALELRKGSADLAPSQSLSADIVGALRRDPNLEVEQEPGTILPYLAFNLP